MTSRTLLQAPLLAVVAYIPVFLIPTNLAHAQLARLGGEFHVNLDRTGNQVVPHVAGLPDGGFVAVWLEGEGMPWWSGVQAVLGRRFDSMGHPVDVDFYVADAGQRHSEGARVSGLPDGGFIVVYDDLLETRILARRYRADSEPMGPAFQVDKMDDPHEPPDRIPDVAVGADGSFVVVWQSAAWDLPGDGMAYTKARRFNEDGTARGPEFLVATDISNYDQYSPSVDEGPDGSFVTVWQTERFAAAWGRGFGLRGEALGPAFLAGGTGNHTGRPDVCVHDNGGFVVAWASYPVGQGLYRGSPIHYRLYDQESEPVSSARRVTPDEIYPSQDSPALACGGGGQFSLVWMDASDAIRGAWFVDPNTGDRSDFRIGLASIGGFPRASVSELTDDRFIVVWHSCNEAEDCDVFGQVFTRSGPVDCTGDCNRDGYVTIDELVTAVRIGLDSYRFRATNCLPADPSLDYEVSVDELVAAVAQALEGCS